MDTEGHSLPSASCGDGRKRRVCYYYDPGVANVDYGANHNMVPRRVAMTHGLVASYGLLNDMTRLRTRPASPEELLAFHDQKYVDLLGRLTPAAYITGPSSPNGELCGVQFSVNHSVPGTSNRGSIYSPVR